ncbi:MAG: hypothetical protein ACJ79H_11550 [Myxococcales bacterium]
MAAFPDMAKLLLLCGGAIIVAMLLGRLRRLLGVVVMLCAAAAAAAVFLLPIDGSTLWQRAQREGLPDGVAAEAAGAWHWLQDRVPGKSPARKLRLRKAGEPLARARDRVQRWDDAAPRDDAPAREPDDAGEAPPKEHLSHGDQQALDRLVSGGRR